jgi:hypothetical protein
MGDIGKTELALQYAIAQPKQSHYPAELCWLECGIEAELWQYCSDPYIKAADR